MKLMIFSDVHLEFYKNLSEIQKPIWSTDYRDATIFAGDICTLQSKQNFIAFAEHHLHFSDVYFVLGNHDYWHCPTLTYAETVWAEVCYELNSRFTNKIHLLTKSNPTVYNEQHNVLFCGSTLWTDFKKGDPQCMYVAKRYMRDYDVIGTVFRDVYGKHFVGITPNEIYNEHIASVNKFVDAQIEAKEKDCKLVFISHHAPSTKSIHEMYGHGLDNYFYVSDLTEMMFESDERRAPVLWVHGHVHNPFHYKIGDTIVVAKAVGYPNEHLSEEYNGPMQYSI